MGRIEDEIARLRAELDVLDGDHTAGPERGAYLDGLARAAIRGDNEEAYPAEEVEKLRGELERLRPAFERVLERMAAKGWVKRDDGTWGEPVLRTEEDRRARRN
jgi:hypothetical protein